ncbi:acetylglutamate kinase [Utexia brackfieldae]|uniref:acetylglutamate kinase n=1 Tax=Utexia brackfieldae TaxID=3074108 RepID=UPI00370D3CB7
MTPLVLKLGGVLLDNTVALNQLFSAIAIHQQTMYRPLVIVHGGGCLVDELLQKLALPIVRRNGLRVTPKAQLDIIVGALAGSANKTLLAEAKKHQLLAIGLCLADGDSVEVKQMSEALGHVGQALPGNPTFIRQLWQDGYLPIMSSIGITDTGEMMNVNADHAAAALANTLSADLVLLSDVAGVLDAQKQKIALLTAEQAAQLIAEGVITDGMVVKVKTALAAASLLKRPVEIASWQQTEQFDELFKGQSIGTRIID